MIDGLEAAADRMKQSRKKTFHFLAGGTSLNVWKKIAAAKQLSGHQQRNSVEFGWEAHAATIALRRKNRFINKNPLTLAP